MTGPDWKCPSCHEEVAGYLHVCSSCGAYRNTAASLPPPAQATVRITSEAQRVSRHNMAVGACWLAGGAFVTLASYQAAAPGGTYVVTTGAIGYGLIRVLVGWSGATR